MPPNTHTHTHAHTHMPCGDLEGIPAWHKGPLHASAKAAGPSSNRSSKDLAPVRGKWQWHLDILSLPRDDLRLYLSGFVTGGR